MSTRIVLAVLAVALAAPATAAAGTVSRNGDVLLYMAAPGERNGVTVEAASPTMVLITDGGAGVDIDPTSNCAAIDLSTPRAGAQCPVDANTMVATQLDDGSDSYVGEEGLTLPEVVGGGAGNDTIETADGADGIDGGAGDDRLSGGPGNDFILGGAGTDVLRGDAGDDTLDGGSRDDKMDARTGGGTDRVDCSAGGDDAVIRSTSDELVDCGLVPRASLRVPRQRVADFFDEDGFDFVVNCARPCAIRWEMLPRDRSTRRRIHDRRRRLDFETPRLDADMFPRYLPGSSELHAEPRGRRTRRDIRAARLLRLRLVVTVVDRNSLETTITRNLTIRR